MPQKDQARFCKSCSSTTYTGGDQTHNLGAVTHAGAFDVKNGRTKRDSSFPALSDESLIGEIKPEKDDHEFSHPPEVRARPENGRNSSSQ
jgi:hypothetical protein